MVHLFPPHTYSFKVPTNFSYFGVPVCLCNTWFTPLSLSVTGLVLCQQCSCFLCDNFKKNLKYTSSSRETGKKASKEPYINKSFHGKVKGKCDTKIKAEDKLTCWCRWNSSDLRKNGLYSYRKRWPTNALCSVYIITLWLASFLNNSFLKFLNIF